jgi:tetratricopeptide (TPR) repeat protein
MMQRASLFSSPTAARKSAMLYSHLLALILLAILVRLSASAACAQTSTAQGLQAPAEPAASLIRELRASPGDKGRLHAARVAGFRLVADSHFQDAWSTFSAILELSPLDQQSMYGGALALFNLRRVAEAKELARRALDLALTGLQGGSSASQDAGGARTAAGGAAVAAAKADAAARASDALVLLGVILAVEKDNAGALGAVERAVELAPESFDAQFALGRARYGTGDPARAAKAFREAVRLRPLDTRARFFLATSLEEANDYEAALKAYRELLDAAPRSAEGHLGLGALLFKIGGEHLAEAIKELGSAVALNGELYEARVTLGRALLRAGRAPEAVEHLKGAARLAPDNPEPHYQLAIAYRRLGQTGLAEQQSAIVRQIHLSRRGAAPAEPTPEKQE